MTEKTPVGYEIFAREYLDVLLSSEHVRDDGRLSSPEFLRLAYGIYEKTVEGSARANLTAILDPRGVAERHILDSIIPLVILERRGLLRDGVRLLDVGCGAGFPSLPVAAAAKCGFPRVLVTAADSTAKKVRHVGTTAAALGLSDITAVTCRAEEAAAPGGDFRGKFDITTARAVASLPVLLELSAPAAKIGGVVTAYKGREDETEEAAAAAKTLGLVLREKIEYSLPSGDARLFVIYEKVSPTPERYPRQYSKIASSPL